MSAADVIAKRLTAEIVGPSSSYNGGRLTGDQANGLAHLVVGTLQNAGYAIVELPEPYPDETVHPYWSVRDGDGPQQVAVTDSPPESAADWIRISFSARHRIVDAATARQLGAAFLAAAEAADPA